MTTSSMDQTAIDALNARFETAHPRDVLAWVAEHFAQSAAIVTSFQPTGIVTLHMVQAFLPDIPVITLDTGLLFPETYTLIDTLTTRLRLNINRVRPQLTLEMQAQQHGEHLWERKPDRCCQLRKVHPLQAALEPYTAWLSGLRRDQSVRRATTPIVAWDNRYKKMKICPFALWTEAQIWQYIKDHQLPYNTLHDRGYPSIGCLPCTRAVTNTIDVRAGRWENSSKTECGLHFRNTDQDKPA